LFRRDFGGKKSTKKKCLLAQILIYSIAELLKRATRATEVAVAISLSMKRATPHQARAGLRGDTRDGASF
jgi:hypothetical protein